MVGFQSESRSDYDIHTDKKYVPYGADLGILHILQVVLPPCCSPSTMCAPTQKHPSGAPAMSNHLQMSPEHVQQDMTGAYPMQGQIRGTSQPSHPTSFGRNGLHVDVFGPTSHPGILRREQFLDDSLIPHSRPFKNTLMTGLQTTKLVSN
ncbi:hypothetical protein BD769DRAFT_1414434 [Suillus cothurnatus]|nr:hypothetical protein BD769DRAFT_1414434 [Suillus cothurnatus]